MKCTILFLLILLTCFQVFAIDKGTSEHHAAQLNQADESIRTKYLNSKKELLIDFETQQGETFFMPIDKSSGQNQQKMNHHSTLISRANQSHFLHAPKIWMVLAALLALVVAYRLMYHKK
ncbi:MAG: hypothetical protein ACPGJS_20840 [Flammeovirgaceae bacterium]